MGGIFTRQNVKEALNGVDVSNEALDKIFALYQSSLQGYVSTSEKDKSVEEAINNYKSSNPIVKPEDSDIYKSLKSNYDSLLLDNTLRDAKVKSRYMSLVKSKLDSADIATSLKRTQEEFPEFFEGDKSEEVKDSKPSISTEVQPASNNNDASKQIYDAFVRGLGK